MNNYPFTVFETRVDTALNLYLTRYLKALNFNPFVQAEAPVAEANSESSPQTSVVHLSALEYSVQKYTGYLILESLCHLYKAGASKELNDALSNILVFARPKNNNNSPYSLIQSILVPDLFYIELGNFNAVDLHLEDSHGNTNSSQFLDDFKQIGFVPLNPSDMIKAKKIKFCPGGYKNNGVPNGEFSYEIKHDQHSLITPHLVNLVLVALQTKTDSFLSHSNSPVNQGGLLAQAAPKIREKMQSLITQLDNYKQKLLSNASEASVDDSNENANNSDSIDHDSSDNDEDKYKFDHG